MNEHLEWNRLRKENKTKQTNLYKKKKKTSNTIFEASRPRIRNHEANISWKPSLSSLKHISSRVDAAAPSDLHISLPCGNTNDKSSRLQRKVRYKGRGFIETRLPDGNLRRRTRLFCWWEFEKDTPLNFACEFVGNWRFTGLIV